MKRLAFNDYKKMPWKNGLGTTYEVLIHPEEATLSELNFSFRISMAQINAANTFSKFPGLERILTVVKGEGITFNSGTLKKFEVKEFKGDESVESSPLSPGDEVIDLGVIYNPQLMKATMKPINNKEEVYLGTHEYEFFINLENLETIFWNKNTKERTSPLKENGVYIGLSHVL